MSASTNNHADQFSQRAVDERAGRRMLRDAVPAAIVGIVGGLLLYVIESKCQLLWTLACAQFSLVEFLFDTFDIAIVIALVAIGSFLYLKNAGPRPEGEHINR